MIVNTNICVYEGGMFVKPEKKASSSASSSGNISSVFAGGRIPNCTLGVTEAGCRLIDGCKWTGKFCLIQ